MRESFLNGDVFEHKGHQWSYNPEDNTLELIRTDVFNPLEFLVVPTTDDNPDVDDDHFVVVYFIGGISLFASIHWEDVNFI